MRRAVAALGLAAPAHVLGMGRADVDAALGEEGGGLFGVEGRDGAGEGEGGDEGDESVDEGGLHFGGWLEGVLGWCGEKNGWSLKVIA